ncbi:MAG TPA: DNA-formamidopyrimidine glycosylase family protein [Frankiaceae bacterium]|jgi:endonuclease-8|nr:DNA-formamidopyrimidine glycosylase family protein [Frankiaceae bacterium]
MPEGHTIHRLAREHRELFGGAVVQAQSPQGRFEDGAAAISGRVLQRVEPYGKHLLYRFEGLPERLHVHLGLYGKFVPGHLPAPEPRGALRLRLVGRESYADLRGPTACELMLPGEVKALLARLGPDPLKPRADPQQAWLRLSRSRTSVGALLMDQAVLAGVGNVYRAEVLYRALLSPFRMGRDVSAAEFSALWTDLVHLMRLGVRDGRIITTLPEDRPAGRRRRPLREDSHYVYRRTGEPCRRCGTAIRTELMAGRNLYWCPYCQK